MIRTIQTDEITKNIKEMCIQANHYLSADMDAAMKHAADTEQSELGKKILHQLQDNLKIADESSVIRSFVKIQKITRRQSFIIPSCRAIR